MCFLGIAHLDLCNISGTFLACLLWTFHCYSPSQLRPKYFITDQFMDILRSFGIFLIKCPAIIIPKQFYSKLFTTSVKLIGKVLCFHNSGLNKYLMCSSTFKFFPSLFNTMISTYLSMFILWHFTIRFNFWNLYWSIISFGIFCFRRLIKVNNLQ